MCESGYMRGINFSQGLPDGYEVIWDSGYEMYYWRNWRRPGSDYQGPFADRFHARREAIAHSKKLV
jgi:hypothetical protein